MHKKTRERWEKVVFYIFACKDCADDAETVGDADKIHMEMHQWLEENYTISPNRSTAKRLRKKQ